MTVHNSKIKKTNLESLLIGLGFTTLFTQVFLIREAGVWLRGNEFIVASVLAAWLMWTATGCFLGFVFSKKHSIKIVHPSWYLSVIFSVAELILLRCFWTFSGQIQGESVSLSNAAFNSFLLTALPCLFSGIASGAAIRSLKDSCDSVAGVGKNKSVAYIYLLETIGALIAGIAVTFIFIPLQHWWFSVAVLFLIPIIPLLKGARGMFIILKSLLILIFFLAAWKCDNSLEHFAQKSSGRFLTGKIVLDIDSPRERFTVTTLDNESAFYINGRLTGSSVQREQAEEISWYSYFSAEKPGTALLIGFPYNGLLRELLQKDFSKITIPDPEKKLINNFSPFLLPEDAKVIKSPQMKIVPEDCRTFLQTHKYILYDCIVQNIGIPESYSSSRLYSKEWFNIIAKHMSSNGTYTIVLPGSAGYVPDDLGRILSRTYTTMNTVFKFVTIIPGSGTLLIASNIRRIPDTPDYWLKKWRNYSTDNSLMHNVVTSIPPFVKGDRGILNSNLWTNANNPPAHSDHRQPHFSRWFNSALINDNLNNFRVAQFTNACAQFKSLPVHKDLSPLLYGDALLYSEARFAGTTHKFLSTLYGNRSTVMIISFIVLLLWLCATYASAIFHFKKTQTWFLMTTLSAVGFIGEMTLLVRFVIARGSLFYSIGLLFAGFMLGLAIATYAIEKYAIFNRQSPFCKWSRGIPIPPFLKGVRGIYSLQLLPIAVVILCATLWTITFAPWPISPSFVMIFSFALNTVCGLCVGTCFAILARQGQNIKQGGMTLYAADLCGAMIGGLLFSIIIPPVLGFGFLTVIITGLLILIIPAIFLRTD